MVPIRGVPGHSGSDHDTPDNHDSLPLKDLESGRSGNEVESHEAPQESDRSDDSLDLLEDEVGQLFPSLRSKLIALIVFHALWAAMFLTILNWSVVGPEIPDYGMPNRLSCGARLWYVFSTNFRYE